MSVDPNSSPGFALAELRFSSKHAIAMISFICASCRAKTGRHAVATVARKRQYSRPSFAPKPVLDLKHIRQNPGLYQQNSVDRNHARSAENSWKILEIHKKLVEWQSQGLALRQRNKVLGKEIQQRAVKFDGANSSTNGEMGELVEEAKKIKEDLRLIEESEQKIRDEQERFALEIVNLSSEHTPVGKDPTILGWINGERPPERFSEGGESHVEVGKELDIIDFEASATTSGWGWYFLKNEGALLEQALIQFALSVAVERGWRVFTPPSLVYGHIASACGFMPRDQNGETQIYNIVQDNPEEEADKRELVLAGTGEIPLAASNANKILDTRDLPIKVIGPSRCYRAEAGARGSDTKGLYRVHEFTKVEMFSWTAPDPVATDRFGSDSKNRQSQTDIVFEEMLDIQRHIIASLGLHAKVLEMPTADLGASASRKVDIEAFFPSRLDMNTGYGELTSASICTDYQSRRLATRLKEETGSLAWPYTLNGTAVAVPRLLACLIENGWNRATRTVEVPEVLRKWMPGEISSIGH